MILSPDRELATIAERLARSLGHLTGCSFTGCRCGAAEQQASALTDYERLKRDRQPRASLKESIDYIYARYGNDLSAFMRDLQAELKNRELRT